MNAAGSSCEFPIESTPRRAGSRILRSQGEGRWEGVAPAEYKQAAEHWCGIHRHTLLGEGQADAAFHVRYFEIEPGGFSSFEHHVHEHAVLILRGRGQVRLGDTLHELGTGDFLYIAPNEPHQLRNPTDTEVLGFLCIVDAQRDTPMPLPPKP